MCYITRRFDESTIPNVPSAFFCLYQNGVHYLAVAIEQGEKDALRIDLHAECAYGVLAFCPAALDEFLIALQSGSGAAARVVGRWRLQIYSSC